MHRRGQSYADDSESLQADVMRFMAIIAFCLIAILALVKHAEPVETTSEADTPQSIPAQPEQTQPQPQPQPEEPQLLASAPPTQPEPEPEPEPEQIKAPEPVPAITVQRPEPPPPLEPPAPITNARAPERPPVPDVEPEPVEEPAPEPVAAAPAEPEEAGLTLRFASDGDFLRLIARGDIQVYAYQDSDVLTLSETYRFLDTQSPGQVYELLRPSIPNLIVDALKQARPDIDGYRWGIALPGHISNQIERHLGQATRGQLVIDRYGDVHHVAAS